MKFALISNGLPPAPSGQAMILFRLLRGLDPTHYCLISQVDYDPAVYRDVVSERMPVRYYRLPYELHPEGRIPPEGRSALIRWGKRYGPFRRLVLLRNIVRRARQIADIIRQENCEIIVACTDHFYDFPAGYLASRLTRTRFYAYVFDDYFHKWIDDEPRRFAQRIEPFLLKGAARIITHNEFLRDDLRTRYGVEAAVVHNPCEVPEYDGPHDPLLGNGREVQIVFTGAIYQAHYDAFRNLIAAIKLLRRPDVKIHIYTGQSPEYLAGEGISGPVVFHGHQSLSAMAGIQQQADLLFLPLAFDSPYPEVIRTSSPTKMSEYLAARRPVLVHAPADSFISWYFREHECGLVVDRRDPAELARALGQILDDPELRRRLSTNAWRRAQADFDSAKVEAKFAALMGIQTPPEQRL